MLKQKLENEKNKAVKPEPNPETGSTIDYRFSKQIVKR